jgi:hypothetical protein
MNTGISINIHANDKNIKDLDKIMSTFFETNKHKVFELCVIDQTKSKAAKALTTKYATKAFIRYALSAKNRKPKYPEVVEIHSVDDVNKLAKGDLPVKPEITVNKVLTPVLSPEELRQENELLLLQLHQVQEELEEYYLKYQEIKNSVAKAG